MPLTKGPTIVQVAGEIAAMLDGPIQYDEFVQRVLAIRPSTSKHPVTQTKSALRYELDRIGLTFADNAHRLVAPIRSVLTGVTVRHVFDVQEISARQLRLRDDDAFLLPGSPPQQSSAIFERLRLVDADGSEVAAKFKLVSRQVDRLFGPHTVSTPALHMPRWLAEHSAKTGDSALLTILDYATPRWQIVYEAAAQRRQMESEAANQVLADLLFEQLEGAQREGMLLREALLIAFAQLPPAQRIYPGDSWSQVIVLDGRMCHDGYQLTYSEHRSLQDARMGRTPAPVSPEQKSTIYRIKIHPTDDKELWRRIEVLGGQTLSELNSYLANEFRHDLDHMGGFWQLIPRGAGKRVREVEIAKISPFADDEDVGAALCIAELALEPGSQLRWVFDFGDWHQYDLLIENVEVDASATAEADFPRVVAQNEPHYLYCTTCQAEGRQTIARWVCVPCSDDVGRTVVLCDACLNEHNEEHYADEIVY